MDKNGNLERGDICHICGDYRCGIEGNICEFLVKFNNLIDLSKNGRFQGECKSCRHRDPEDKKCDCGGLERQGCPFPVSDDYYCKYYEKGGAE